MVCASLRYLPAAWYCCSQSWGGRDPLSCTRGRSGPTSGFWSKSSPTVASYISCGGFPEGRQPCTESQPSCTPFSRRSASSPYTFSLRCISAVAFDSLSLCVDLRTRSERGVRRTRCAGRLRKTGCKMGCTAERPKSPEVEKPRGYEVFLVEMRRLELLTSNLQSWRSTN